jgi:hypothetical protein
MTDPRNVAHDKRVKREKKHHGAEVHRGTAPAERPGMKPPLPGRGPDTNESIESIDTTESVERH